MSKLQIRTTLRSLILGSLPLLVLLGCDKGGEKQSKSGQEQGSNKKVVLAKGKILPAQGFTNLGAPGVVVEKVHCSAGDFVKKGARLLTLQSRSILEQQIAGAEARRAELKITLKNTIEQARMKMEVAQLKKTQLEQQLERLEPDQKEVLLLADEQIQSATNILGKLQRIASEPLTEEFVGAIDIERQQSAIKNAELELEKQSLATKQSRTQLTSALKAAEKEFDVAERMFLSAQNSNAERVAQAEAAALQAQLQATETVAPFDAVVVAVNVSSGGISTGLPPVVLADISNMVCEIEINELDASRVQVNDLATVTSRAFGETLSGKVIRKSSVVGQPQLQNFDPLARVDYRSMTAVIEITDEKHREKASNWLKLQVEVEIDVDASSSPAVDENTEIAS